MTVSIRDSYANMRPIIENHMELVDEARHAFEACGVKPIVQPIRGGTDGARLSHKGLPCPNLSTGGYLSTAVMNSFLRNPWKPWWMCWKIDSRTQ